MNDRELLEAAARAAGYETQPLYYNDQSGVYRLCVVNGNDYWNPLDDDGDALRLAVALDLTVMIGAVRDCAGRLSLDKADDNLTATRRAIVRAAAALAPTTGEGQ